MLTVLFTVIGGIVGVLGLLIIYIQWRESHSDRLGTRLTNTVKAIIAAETKPLDAKIADNTLRLGQSGERLVRIEKVLESTAGQISAVVDQQARMGVKVDMYWTSMEALAMNAAKQIHQPDPARAHVDKLLEAFMEGTLTAEERIELRKILVTIRNYEPNGTTPLDFPVHPGEQTAAAILLSTMDLVDPSRMAALGHATHRNHGAANTGTIDSVPLTSENDHE